MRCLRKSYLSGKANGGLETISGAGCHFSGDTKARHTLMVKNGTFLHAHFPLTFLLHNISQMIIVFSGRCGGGKY